MRPNRVWVVFDQEGREIMGAFLRKPTAKILHQEFFDGYPLEDVRPIIVDLLDGVQESPIIHVNGKRRTR